MIDKYTYKCMLLNGEKLVTEVFLDGKIITTYQDMPPAFIRSFISFINKAYEEGKKDGKDNR